MSLRPRRKRSGPAVDLSPMIDMTFLLLIFFMVTTTFVQDQQLDLERPGSSSGEPASTKALRVAIDRSGALWVGDTPVRPWMLQSRVRDLLRDGGDGAVLVVADRRTPAERLVEVVDQCRLAGATNVGVVTDAEGG